MKLTNKADKYFYKWFVKGIGGDGVYHYESIHHGTQVVDIEDFWDKLPDSMQYSVLVDWFDSVGIYITDGSGRFALNKDHYFYWVIEVKGKRGQYDHEDTYETRPEARTNAIEKANEIYNES